MTDLEIKKLCAKAMGIETTDDSGQPFLWGEGLYYDPLHNDAQAMALVKKFGVAIMWFDQLEGRKAQWWRVDIDDDITIRNADLNRAICECVAKMQAAKASSPPQAASGG